MMASFCLGQVHRQCCAPWGRPSSSRQPTVHAVQSSSRCCCSSSSSSSIGSSPNSSSSSSTNLNSRGHLHCKRSTRQQQRRQAASSGSEPSSLQASYDADSVSQPAATSTSAAAAIAANAANADDYGYMQEYAALKQQLLDNTRKSGGAIGLYLLLTVNGAAALAAMVGAAASYAYFSMMCRDVDTVKPTDTVPIWEANKIENVLLRRAAKVKAAYQKSLNPRLLVPAGLGLLVGIANKVVGGENGLDLVYPGCLLLGFLSYKGALILKLIDDLTPKSFGPEKERPKVEKFDEELELDQWGRPRKRMANPIDVMPEDKQAKAYEELEKQLERQADREQQ